MNHNVVCYGYSIIIEIAAVSTGCAQALNIPKQYWSRLQKGETIETPENVFTPDMVMGPPRKGIKLTHCTDTRPTEGIVKNAAEADLFICEGMYGEPEKRTRAREYKHSDLSGGGGYGKTRPGQADVADPLQSFPHQAGRLYGWSPQNLPSGHCRERRKSIDLLFEED